MCVVSQSCNQYLFHYFVGTPLWHIAGLHRSENDLLHRSFIVNYTTFTNSSTNIFKNDFNQSILMDFIYCE